MWLAIVVIAAFLSAFSRELIIFKAFRLAMNPLEIMFIGAVDAVFLTIKLFIPALLAAAVLKYIIAKAKRFDTGRIAKRSFKKQMLISFLLAAAFAGLFYTDVSFMTGYKHQLLKSSLEVFVLFFASILLTMTSMYGLLKGFKPIISKTGK